MRALALLLLLLGPASPALAFEKFALPPVDEAVKDKSFAEFRRALLETVEKRDVKALLQVISPKIEHSFAGGPATAKAFAHSWKLDSANPRDSELWEELRTVLQAGGSFKGKNFEAPYTFSTWPDQYDAFDYLAVVVKSAALKAQASESASTLETLSYEIVARNESLPRVKGWQAVRTASGKAGYLPEAQARSPIDYRAGFTKEKGSWKMSSFVAGD